MQDVIIDYNVWLRGEGPDNSYLHRQSDGKMCCVGIIGVACGLRQSQLTGLRDARSVSKANPTQKIPAVYAALMQNERLAYTAYHTNDKISLGDTARENYLIEVFAPLGINLIFINRPV